MMAEAVPPTNPDRKSRLDDLLGRSTAERISGIDLRYSRIVKKLRLILPILAAILIVVVFVLAGPDDAAQIMDADKVLPGGEAGQNELVTPRFESQDGDAQPYSVTATRAFQKQGANVIELEKPVADMTLKDNTWLALKANDGEYNQENQKIHLKGNVRLFHDEGYELVTDAVDIDIKNQTAQSDQPVRGHGPVGRIKASGFEAQSSADLLRFKGPAKLTVYSEGESNLLEPAAPAPNTAPDTKPDTFAPILTETP
jgi:lipopolysaccharide export system protein LptC